MKSSRRGAFAAIRSTPWSVAVVASVGWLAAACAAPMRVSLLAAGVKAPAQVAMLFSVDRAAAEAVLADKNVSVSEDGASLPRDRARIALLDARDVVAERTVVLVDASAGVVESGQIGDEADAVARLVLRLEKTGRVAVAAFDGAEGVVGIVPFSAKKASVVDRRLDSLLTFKPRGRTTNLNGAIIESLDALERAQLADPRPVKVGRLLVLMGGRDDAKLVARAELAHALRLHKDIEVWAVGFGELLDAEGVEAIGRDHAVYQKRMKGLTPALERFADKVEEEASRRYLVSYCSPHRDGRHIVELVVRGNDGRKGTLRWSFDASDFKNGCDSERTPNFIENLDAASSKGR